jgi:nitrilase
MTAARFAVIQMVSGNDLQANLDSAARLIKQAAEQGAQLLVLPETFALFSSRQQAQLGQQETFGEQRIRGFLRQQAKQYGLWIVGGTLPLALDAEESRVLAASFVINERGQEVARYDKIHLFDVEVEDKQGSYRESDTFLAGDHLTVVDTPFGRLGVAVCYDIRFPELFVAMRQQGADIIAVPAAFTRLTGQAHWLPLLKARAIENQCLILGANQGGIHSRSRSTSGGSVIVDSWGQVLAEAGLGETVVLAEADFSAQQKLRSNMPVVQHRQSANYSV